MRTSFRWALRLQTRLQLLCACCAFWCAPAAALASPEGGGVSGKRVLVVIGSLIAVGCLVGMVAGRDPRGTRGPRLRLLNDPKKTPLSVLVPPGPAPRLIPSESPNAIRPRPPRAPTPRHTPDGTTSSGIVDYIAAFADPPEAGEIDRVDYLLVPDEGAPESADPDDTPDREPSPTQSSDP